MFIRLLNPTNICPNCKLPNKGNKTPGVGNPKADIMIISDMPEHTESLNLRPFTGQSSEIVVEALNQCGIAKEDVYYTYAVKCSSKFRKFDDKDVAYCYPYLEEELFTIKPKVIITLGKNAMYSVLTKTTLNKYRGTINPLKAFNTMVIPTYSPLQVLKVPEMRKTFFKDFYTAISQVKDLGTTKIEHDYKIIITQKDFDDFMDEAEKQKILGADIETTGLEYYKKDVVMGFSFSYKPYYGRFIALRYTYSAEKTPIYTEANIARLKRLLENDALKIFHNGQFDLKFILKEFGISVRNFGFDTLLAHHMLNENEEHNLAFVGSRYPDVAGWKLKFKSIKTDGNPFLDVPLEHLGEYACVDADVTLRLYYEFIEQITKEFNNVFFNLVMPMTNLLKEVEYNGVKINVPYVEKLLSSKMEIRQGFVDKLYELCGKTLNLNSNPELIKLIHNELALPIIKKHKKTGTPSLDEEVILTLMTTYCGKETKEYNILANLLEYRGVNKLITTYLEPFLEKRDSNDRIHGSFLLYGTKTGRLSSREPNLQNIPNTPEMRNCFIPSDNRKFVVMDFSQIEVRVVANFSNDPVLINDFMSSDFHKNTASQLFNLPVEQITEEQRQFAKTANFGIIYDMSAHSFGEIQNISEQEAQQYIDRYFDRYKELKKWHTKIKRDIERDSYVESLFGRKRRLKIYSNMEDFDKDEIYKQAINSPVQSTASDICVLTALRIQERLKIENIDANLVLSVHDELVYDCEEAKADRLVEVIKEEVAKPIDGVKVTLTASCKVVDAWY